MKKHIAVIAAAAALTVAGMNSFAEDVKVQGEVNTNQAETTADRAANSAENTADRAADSAQSAADRAGDTAQQAGDKAGDMADKALQGQGLKGTAQAPDAEGIRDILASTTEAAVTKDGLNDMVERFVDADRNRIGDAVDDMEINQLVQQFQDAWRAKYNKEFNITNEELVFKPDAVQIVQGEIGSTDAAQTAGDRPAVDVDVNADANRTGTGAAGTADVSVDNRTGVDAPGQEGAQTAADRNRNDPGRNTATVTLPASHGLPELQVPLIHELPDNWRIDVPDNVDANTLKTNVQKHLQMALDQKDQWSDDENAAALAVSHHIMAGLFEGQQGQTGGAAGSGAAGTGAGGTLGTDAGTGTGTGTQTP